MNNTQAAELKNFSQVSQLLGFSGTMATLNGVCCEADRSGAAKEMGNRKVEKYVVVQICQLNILYAEKYGVRDLF